MSLLLGAIADDFTGASDLANTLVTQGMKVTQVIGVPDATTDIGDAEAVVIALKSRSEPAADAVAASLDALNWLESRGCRQFFFKYCSTFDSTAKGNIGPVADALMTAVDSDFSLVCPAFPANGRTVYQGNLFVGPLLLSESTMKDHPLTPMRDASLLRLMDAQSTRRSGLISLQHLHAGTDAVLARIDALKRQGISYGIIDAIDDADLINIGLAAAEHRLLTGASGLAMGLPENYRKLGLLAASADAPLPDRPGRQLVLAGSCSAATRAQIDAVRDLWPQHKIDIDALAAGSDVVTEICAWATAQDASKPVLIYASSDPAEVAAIQQRHGVEAAGAMIEQLMGTLSQALLEKGFTRLIVAGGETSGAVVSALGIKALRIGPEIDPGVPWTQTLDEHRIALALKSGNFGGLEFFDKAFGMLP